MTLPLPHPHAGFTLLELVIVLALVGLVFSLSPAVLPGLRDATALERSTRQLADDLRELRGRAIAGNQQTVLLLDEDGSLYHLMPEKRERQLPQGMALSLDPLPEDGRPAGLRFFPDGSATAAVLALSYRGRSKHVTVQWISGKVTADD